MKKILSVSVIVILILLVDGCATIPITGRKQVNLLPKATMTQMGFSNYSDFLKDNPLSNDKSAEQTVKRAGVKISQAVGNFMRNNGMEKELKHYQWEFSLVQDKTPNAWCMPGGKVVFYEGILPLTRNEAGIAVVMGHEIAHAIARHGNERMSHGLITQLGGMALTKAIEQQPEQTQQIFLTAYGLGSQVGVLLPYSRLHEKEADRLGLIFMAMAGYNPREAIVFWQRMAAQDKKKMPEWLSTHPMDETRIADMKANMPEALRYFKSGD